VHNRPIKIHIFDLEKMEPLQVLETDPNPTGVCALSEQSYLAYPRGNKVGISNDSIELVAHRLFF